MPLRQATLNRQLEQASARLSAWAKVLTERGVSKEVRASDAKWRKLSAECAQIRGRMKTVASVVARDAAAVQRKAEKLAAPKAEPKAKGKSADKGAKEKPKKEKKPKAEKAAKGA
jgi:hypothetical protein